jgi:hypothetical protein
MVVVPTETHVELSYGRTGVEFLSYGLTLLGLAGLVLLIRHPRYGFSGRARVAAEAGAADGVEPAYGDAPEVGPTDAGVDAGVDAEVDADPPPGAGDGDGDGDSVAGAGGEQAAGERQPPGP